MKKKRKLLKWTGILALGLSIYPLCVLVFTWTSVFRSDLAGGRDGPLDAYRHALASSVVSYTLGEWAVNLVSAIGESKTKDSGKMDRHNNHIGARIGSKAKSFHELEPAVRQSVSDGAVNSNNPEQITWMPREKWRNVRAW